MGLELKEEVTSSCPLLCSIEAALTAIVAASTMVLALWMSVASTALECTVGLAWDPAIPSTLLCTKHTSGYRWQSGAE